MQSRTRLRVGLVTSSASSLGGGVSEVVRLHANALVDAGYSVVVIAPWDGGNHNPSSWRARVSFSSLIGTRRFCFSPGILVDLFKGKFDIIHVHGIWTFHCLAALIWCQIKGGKVFISPHGMVDPWILNRSKLLKRFVSTLYQDTLFRSSSAVHVLTKKEAEQVKDLYPGVRTVEIPNYVPPCHHHATNEELLARKRLNQFTFLGRITDKKGCIELLKGWISACESSRDFAKDSKLVFYGWLDGLPEFKKEIASICSGEISIEYRGSVSGSERDLAYQSSSFFVLPSKSEGLPMAVLEAWSFGVPSLISSECNLPIGFSSGASLDCGMTSDSISASLLAAFRLSDEEYISMAQKAKNLSSSVFSLSEFKRQIIELYKANHEA